MVFRKLGLATLVMGVLTTARADAQPPLGYIQWPSARVPTPQQVVYPDAYIIGSSPCLQAHQPSQPTPYRTWPHLDELMQMQAEPLSLPVKELEYGKYSAVIKSGEKSWILNEFIMQPATPGYTKPNSEQTTSWKVLKTGIYDISVMGNNWPFRLGFAPLNSGDEIHLIKEEPLNSQPTPAQQPALTPTPALTPASTDSIPAPPAPPVPVPWESNSY